ncbi:hypothetical protein I79_005798 [Cricetulus griseus]|uniref:Uncharacterized protein n=1 Tax=Cricetulus griseus TaxID=10029 RepID=G3H647_CRIGR|nr:hypothetical protein I79_005798 [Cricetulus griseus]
MSKQGPEASLSTTLQVAQPVPETNFQSPWQPPPEDALKSSDPVRVVEKMECGKFIIKP